VDRGVRPVLVGLGLPLILACAEPLDSIYRSVNSYPDLAEAGIPGNPETASASELAGAARGILDELYAAELNEVRNGVAEHELPELARPAQPLQRRAHVRPPAAHAALDQLPDRRERGEPGRRRAQRNEDPQQWARAALRPAQVELERALRRRPAGHKHRGLDDAGGDGVDHRVRDGRGDREPWRWKNRTLTRRRWRGRG
jgi:hypothetical protein